MKHKYLVPIAVLFTAALLIADTVGSKIIVVAGLNLPAGVIVFPLSYLAGDILTEVYGYSVSRRVIWSALAALLLMVGCYEIARALPAAEFWGNQAAFDVVFSHVPRLVFASGTAYLCGEFVNSYVVAKMKVWTDGKAMPVRFVVSTVFGELVDTVIFVAIAFAGVFPPSILLTIILANWAVKVAWEVAALPISVPFVRWLKRVEQEDVYDRNTNFNPFRV